MSLFIGDADDDEESDLVVAQVFDELGLELTEELAELRSQSGGVAQPKAVSKVAAPSGGGGSSNHGSGGGAPSGGASGGLDDIDADLQARLDNLRKGDN